MKKISTLLVAFTCILSLNAATETVYFVNAQDWTGTIKAYGWGGTGSDTWPGNAMTKEAEQIAGKDVYSYTKEAGTYPNIIFTNGSKQTADLKWTAGKYYVKDGWYTKEEAAIKLGQPIEYESIYFVNVQGWENVNIYTWTPEVQTWPGELMTKETEKIGEYDLWSYTIEKGTTFGGILFNNGQGTQTADLKWQSDMYFVKDQWYTKDEAIKVVSNGVLPTVQIAGSFNNWAMEYLIVSEDQQTASITLTLSAEEHKFKIIQEGIWLGNASTISRDNYADFLFEQKDGEEYNCTLNADMAGDYVFTWKLTDQTLSVAFPTQIAGMDEVTTSERATKTVYNGQIVVVRDGVIYNILGQEVQ